MRESNRFTLVYESGSTKTTKEFNAYTTDVIFDNFEDFLRGCGFVIDGHIDICNGVCVTTDSDETGDVVIDWTVNQIDKLNEQPIITDGQDSSILNS